ncbi:MAG: ABC transporter ATP-binding protein [Thermoplasmata archaeon]|nr:ABC transporter ATP-binding protein [Thermoplasmata archaeon]
MEPLVTLQDVSAGYDGSAILHNVNLELREGDFMAVVGPNGGGKTTLFRTILGLIEPMGGDIRVTGTTPSKGCVNIGYVPQFGSFDRKYPALAEEVVTMGLRQSQTFNPFSRKDKEAVRKAMEYTGVDAFARKRIGDLSGGQMQRTLLARALVSGPRILLLDEPTASLDPEMRSGVYNILRKASSDGITVMMITHDLKGAEDCVNRIVKVDRTVTEIDRGPHGMGCGGGIL